jgi:hypothetical protein
MWPICALRKSQTGDLLAIAPIPAQKGRMPLGRSNPLAKNASDPRALGLHVIRTTGERAGREVRRPQLSFHIDFVLYMFQ